jgi:hypothetical protein
MKAFPSQTEKKPNGGKYAQNTSVNYWTIRSNKEITYYQVSAVPWRIITGSESDDWIYWCCCYGYTYLQPLITAHNRWLPQARYISFLDHECLPIYCGWLINFLGWLVGWLVYSCCSHLEHRASVKRSVSLQFLNLRHSMGLPIRVISPSQGRYLTQTQNKHTDIHASSGIWTHDPSVRTREDSSCLRPRGHCDRQLISLLLTNSFLIRI